MGQALAYPGVAPLLRSNTLTYSVLIVMFVINDLAYFTKSLIAPTMINNTEGFSLNIPECSTFQVLHLGWANGLTHKH
jgi:hypothetical protein